MLEDIFADTTQITGKDLVLEPNFNTLSMHVATPFYGNHYNLHLEYQLSDVSAKWIKVSDQGNIRFNRLPSGNYHLYIRKLSGYGADNTQVIDFEFKVLPHWYSSLWFTILWVCGGAFFSFLYVRHKDKMAIKRQVVLEKKVGQRTLELNATMEELGKTVDQLKISEAKLRQTSAFREQITSLVLHDIRSPLMFLDSITETIYSSSIGVVPNTFRQKLYDLHTGVKEIGGYAQRLLIWVNIQQDDFTMKRKMVDMLPFLQENATYYQPLAQQKGLTVTCFAPSDIHFYGHPNLLEIVVRNLLDNAIKHTESGQISLTVGLARGILKISVMDTGIGMSPDKVKLLMTNNATFVSSDTGLGYRFIHDVLKKINGTLEIESQLDKGTTVSIIFKASSFDLKPTSNHLGDGALNNELQAAIFAP